MMIQKLFVGAPLQPGITTPGAVIIGGKPAAQLPPAIDMTAPTLDPRITYTGPQHYFWNSAGGIELCSDNEWPLEFRNGSKIGRHEPEPAAINLQPQSRATVPGDYVKMSGIDDFQTTATGGPDGGAIALLPISCDVYALSQDIGGAYLFPPTNYTHTDDWQLIAFTVTSTTKSALRLWLGRNNAAGRPAFWLTPGILDAGTYTASFFTRSNNSDTFRAGFGQIESGSVATSPIVTANTTASRPAASVTVDTAGASSLTVTYSNGFSDTYATDENTFTLPTASRNWSERYITRIEFK